VPVFLHYFLFMMFIISSNSMDHCTFDSYICLMKQRTSVIWKSELSYFPFLCGKFQLETNLMCEAYVQCFAVCVFIFVPNVFVGADPFVTEPQTCLSHLGLQQILFEHLYNSPLQLPRCTTLTETVSAASFSVTVMRAALTWPF